MVTNCDKTLFLANASSVEIIEEKIFVAVFHTIEHRKTNKNVNYLELEMRHTLAKHLLLNQDVSKK